MGIGHLQRAIMTTLDRDYVIMQASYLRCCASAGFFDSFYATFLSKSPEVALKFSRTNLTNQKKMLRNSLFRMVADAQNEAVVSEETQRIGVSHGRGHHDIPPAMYVLWLESLCEAIKQHDPGYDEELERVWREKLGRMIERIVALY